jgi:hypothetical protein
VADRRPDVLREALQALERDLAQAPRNDQRLGELLPAVAARQTPDPAFRARLEQALGLGPEAAAPPARNGVAAAAAASGAAASRASRARGDAGHTTPAREAATVIVTPPARPRPSAGGRRRLLAAALSFPAAAAAVWMLAPRLPPLAPPTQRLAADAPVRLCAPAGRSAGAEVAAVARLELRDGAEVAYQPAGGAHARASFELADGYLRVATPRSAPAPVEVHAAGHRFEMAPGADAAFELRRLTAHAGAGADTLKGEHDMRPLWLIPTSAVSGGALTLAVLVLQGRVALSGVPAGAAAAPPPGQVMVLRPEGEAAEAAGGPRRVADLEQKVAALRQENGRLAGQLAKSKGVTVESVLERIGRLKNASMAATFSPGTVTDLVTDLKGLGDEGARGLVGLLESSDPDQRFFAAFLLERLNAKVAIPGLRKAALEDKEKMPSVMAGHALALMDDPDTVPALREIVAAKKNWESEVNALWGLCKHGDQKAIADALAFMKDPQRSKDMRLGLGANLMMLSDPELMPIVDETLRQFDSKEEVAKLAVTYYKTTKTPEGRARLEAMAANPKLAESVRKEAREALAK